MQVVLIVIILLTLHLKVLSFGGFDVALTWVLIPLFLLTSVNAPKFKIRRYHFFLLLLVVFLPFMSLKIKDWGEFFKTYMQFAVSYFMVAYVLFKDVKINIKSFDKTLRMFQVISVVLVVYQYVVAVILGKLHLYNIFQDLQLYYPATAYALEGRMKSVYLEPSYLGFVVVCIFWCRYNINGSIKIGSNIILTIILLLFSKSAFGILGFIAFLVFEYFNKEVKFKYIKWILGVIVGLLLFIFFSKDIIIALRLNEFNVEPTDQLTSGYMRVILPVITIYNLFMDGYYLGLPFGDLDYYVFNVFNEFGEASMSNSFFLIIAYWGLLGIAAYILVLYIFVKNKKYRSFILLVFLSLNSSGAFVTHQFAFVTFVLPIIVFKLNESREIIIDCISCHE